MFWTKNVEMKVQVYLKGGDCALYILFYSKFEFSVNFQKTQFLGFFH